MAKAKNPDEKKKPKRRRATGKVDYRKMLVPMAASMGVGFLGEMVKEDGTPMIPRIKAVGIEGTYGPILIAIGASSKGKMATTLMETGAALTFVGVNKIGATMGKTFVKAAVKKKLNSPSVNGNYLNSGDSIDGAFDVYDEDENEDENLDFIEGIDDEPLYDGLDEPDGEYWDMPGALQ